MSDFFQNGIITTLHDFETKSTKLIEEELLRFSKERKMELILPCLFSELKGDALPKIVSEIAKTNYLHHIIIGLDQANEKHAKKAWTFYEKLETTSTASSVKKKQEGDYLENLLSYSLTLNKLDQNYQPTDGHKLSFKQVLPIYSDDLSIGNTINLLTN